MTSSTFSKRIAMARKEADMTVAQVSRLVAVKAETYKKWESGAVQPRANKLVTLAGVLNVAPVWLLDGNDDYHSEDLDKQQKVEQLSMRIEQMQSMQNRMITMLDELACDLDDVDTRVTENS